MRTERNSNGYPGVLAIQQLNGSSQNAVYSQIGSPEIQDSGPKPELFICQLADERESKLRRNGFFWIQQLNKTNMNHVRPNLKHKMVCGVLFHPHWNNKLHIVKS